MLWGSVLAVLLALASAAPAVATFTQTMDSGKSLNAVSCVPASTTCVLVDSGGNALYTTNANATSPATWNPWSGPGPSPGHAIACPAATLCVLATGEVSGTGGGNLYRATALGGTFLNSVKPANGVGAISCASISFCVTANEGGGYIRYSTKPSGISWVAVSIGTGAMKDVSCLSPAFCAVVDDSGNVHVATTEEGVKKAAGWNATNLDGATALRGVACSSSTSCLAVDGSGEVLDLTIDSSGEATAAKRKVDGAHQLEAVSCSGATCALADSNGALFSSTDAGQSWTMRYGGGAPYKSISCPSSSLCAAAATSGEATTFDPTAPVAPLVLLTSELPAGIAGTPYEAQPEAQGGTPRYRWAASGLPPGLSIDRTSGRISGTPRTAACLRPCQEPSATYSITVIVTGGDGASVSRQLTIALRGSGSEPEPSVAPVVTKLKTSHRLWRVGRGPGTPSMRTGIPTSARGSRWGRRSSSG